jgi:AraC-like DNA-binding protein
MQNHCFEDMLETVFSTYKLRAQVKIFKFCIDDDFLEQDNSCQFIIINEGQIIINNKDMEDSVFLGPGDLVVFPFGISDNSLEIMPYDVPDPDLVSALIVRGSLEFFEGNANPILSSFPKFMIVRSIGGGESRWGIAPMLIAAARDDRVGKHVVLNKLVDTLFTLVICEHLHRSSELRGIFAALADARLSRALEAIHCRAGEDWDIPSLAGVAGMSRSAFVNRFGEIMGVPPMQYLTSWRILQAKKLLQDRHLSVATVAEMIGYSSEVAFRKVFKRAVGKGPGEFRSNRPIHLKHRAQVLELDTGCVG